jgi:hypothetical protein
MSDLAKNINLSEKFTFIGTMELPGAQATVKTFDIFRYGINDRLPAKIGDESSVTGKYRRQTIDPGGRRVGKRQHAKQSFDRLSNFFFFILLTPAIMARQ